MVATVEWHLLSRGKVSSPRFTAVAALQQIRLQVVLQGATRSSCLTLRLCRTCHPPPSVSCLQCELLPKIIYLWSPFNVIVIDNATIPQTSKYSNNTLITELFLIHCHILQLSVCTCLCFQQLAVLQQQQHHPLPGHPQVAHSHSSGSATSDDPPCSQPAHRRSRPWILSAPLESCSCLPQLQGSLLSGARGF